MKRCKRILSILLLLLLPVFSCISSDIPPTYAESDPSSGGLEIGDYVSFGHFLKEPILWRVIDRDPQKGVLLWSEKIVTIKAYDSTGNAGVATNTERYRVGSNFWGRSTLREWLNSDQPVLSYANNPPDEDHVWLGMNDYANKPGFLREFSGDEKSLIASVTQKSILSETDRSLREGGTVPFAFQGSRNPEKSVKNYAEAYFHSVTDRVFLVDIWQLAEFVSKRGFGIKKMPTKSALEASEFKHEEMAPDKTFMYWLRMPMGNSDSGMLKVSADGVIGDVVIDNRNLGVVPALYLRPSVAILSGSGTAAKPFTVGAQSNGYTPPKRQTAVASAATSQGTQVEQAEPVYDDKTLNTPSPWASEAVAFFENFQLLQAGTFAQYRKPLTRQEAAYLTVRLYEYLTGTPISDASLHLNNIYLDTNDEYVRKAFAIGVMNGYADGRFGAAEELTREQMMTILVKLLARIGIDLPLEKDKIATFLDENRISEWALDFVKKAYHYGLVKGTADGVLSPKNKLTKEQALVLLHNIVKNRQAIMPAASKPAFNPILKWAYGGTYDTWCEEAWYSTPAIADLDGDGAVEVIGSAYSLVNVDGKTGKLNWRIASGHDIREPQAKYEGRTWPDILMEDVDGDGEKEIITAHQKGYLAVYDKKGNFKKGWPQKPAKEEFRALKVADLDRDGKMEIIAALAGNSGQNIWVYNYDGTIRKGWPQLDAAHNATERLNQGMQASKDTSFAWGVFNDTLAVGNINSDKYLEIIVPSDVPFVCAYDKDGKLLDTNTLYKGRKWGQVGFWESVEMENRVENEGWGAPLQSNTPQSQRNTVNFAHGGSAIADMNNDGKNEIIVTGTVYDRMIGHPPGLYTTAFILNADRTRFQTKGADWSQAPKDTGKPLSEDYNLIEYNMANPVISDLDNDGTKEILFSSFDGKVHCLSLDKTEKQSWPYRVYNPDETGRELYEFASVPTVVDLDRDGKKEVIFTSWTEKEPAPNGRTYNGRLFILNHKGDLLKDVELPFSLGTKQSNGALASPLVVDIDGDNQYEIVVNTVYSGLVAYDL